MVLSCEDGRRIPCLRFDCLVTCEVIRNVAEDTALSKDERGRAVVPFPGVDSSDLALAIEAVHKVRAVDSLPADCAPAVLRGLDALGHQGSLRASVLEHMWQVMPRSLAHVRPHVDELVRVPTIRLDVLRKLAVLCPTWPEFEAQVVTNLRLDVRLGIFLLEHLSKFFPAGPLFVGILRQLPTSVLTQASVLDLFTAPRNALLYHPEELSDVLRGMIDKFASGGWDPTMYAFLKALVTAGRVFDVAPHVASGLYGSIVMIRNNPSVSVLLTVMERKRAVSRKMACWLWMSIDWALGLVDAKVSLWEVCETPVPTSCYVRLTAYLPDASCAEVWYAVPHVNPWVPFRLSQQGVPAAGDLEGFRALVRNPVMHRLRVDLFYNGQNVLKKAFF